MAPAPQGGLEPGDHLARNRLAPALFDQAEVRLLRQADEADRQAGLAGTPVRPMRYVVDSERGRSKFTTTGNCAMSMPRPARSVDTTTCTGWP